MMEEVDDIHSEGEFINQMNFHLVDTFFLTMNVVDEFFLTMNIISLLRWDSLGCSWFACGTLYNNNEISVYERNESRTLRERMSNIFHNSQTEDPFRNHL